MMFDDGIDPFVALMAFGGVFVSPRVGAAVGAAVVVDSPRSFCPCNSIKGLGWLGGFGVSALVGHQNRKAFVRFHHGRRLSLAFRTPS